MTTIDFSSGVRKPAPGRDAARIHDPAMPLCERLALAAGLYGFLATLLLQAAVELQRRQRVVDAYAEALRDVGIDPGRVA